MSANKTNKSPIFHKFESSVFHNLFTKLQTGETLQYPLQTNPSLECEHFDVSHFVSLLRNELTEAEGMELIDHLPDCNPCATVYCEVYKTYEYISRVTRAEELNFLRTCFGGVSTLKFDLNRRHGKRQLAKLERKLKRHFQDELSCTLQGALMAFVEASKNPFNNKLKKRLDKAEIRIQELEQTLAQVLNNNAQLMEVR